MKRKIGMGLLGLMFLTQNAAYAFPVHDPLNYAINQIRNTILESKFGESIILAAERLQQLRNTYEEILRFNEGIDEFIEGLIGDPLGDMLDASITEIPGGLGDASWVVPHIEMLEAGENFRDVHDALSEINGIDPELPERPYITFEDYQVTQAFRFTKAIRDAGEVTREAADDLKAQAQNASPKGAARITAGATAGLMVLGQQAQEAEAEQVDLLATLVSQGTRKDKILEHQRIAFTDDVNDLLAFLVRP